MITRPRHGPTGMVLQGHFHELKPAGDIKCCSKGLIGFKLWVIHG